MGKGTAKCLEDLIAVRTLSKQTFGAILARTCNRSVFAFRFVFADDTSSDRSHTLWNKMVSNGTST